jgi:transcriptional regulator with XRE-family HTH domain
MPLIVPSGEIHGQVVRAAAALGFTQKELGERLDVSTKTAGRWMRGDASPNAQQVATIARLVHPLDAALAAALAHEAGTTLVALGLEKPGGAKDGPQGSRPYPPIALLVDSVLRAAADAERQSGETRDVLLAAFERARGLGLTIDEVCEALRP